MKNDYKVEVFTKSSYQEERLNYYKTELESNDVKVIDQWSYLLIEFQDLTKDEAEVSRDYIKKICNWNLTEINLSIKY